MENLQAITSFFRQVWNVFTIDHPLIGIPFSVIYLGVFAIAFSIVILRPLLGIGGGVIDNISSSARNARRSAISRSKARKESSYKTYAKKRARQEAYAARYEGRK